MEAQIRDIRDLRPDEPLSRQDGEWIRDHNTPTGRDKASDFVGKLSKHVGVLENITKRLDHKTKFFGGEDQTAQDKSRKIHTALQAVPLEDLGHIGDQDYAKDHAELKDLHHEIAAHRDGSTFKTSEDGVVDKNTASNSFKLLMAKTKDGSDTLTPGVETSQGLGKK